MYNNKSTVLVMTVFKVIPWTYICWYNSCKNKYKNEKWQFMSSSNYNQTLRLSIRKTNFTNI